MVVVMGNVGLRVARADELGLHAELLLKSRDPLLGREVREVGGHGQRSGVARVAEFVFKKFQRHGLSLRASKTH